MSVQIHNSRYEGIQQKAETVIGRIEGLLEQGYSLCSATSFGKDSSAVLVLMLEAMRRFQEKGGELPECFVSHSNTQIENPAMDSYTGEMIQSLEAFIDEHQLPLQVVLAEPSLTSSFFYTTIGRGKLPRFVDSKSRQCSVDWKVRPQEKALKSIRKQVGQHQDLVMLVGSRETESASRGERMREAGRTAEALIPMSDDGKLLSNACIADWQFTDVWELLMACDSKRGGIYSTYVDDFEFTLELYKSANEGMCAVITGDGGNKAACGSRFGCGICTLTGKRDKSMEAMIDSDPDQFGYLTGINRLRNFLVRTQHDFSRRSWIQRSISEIGYVALSPDTYSPEMRRELLRYMITLDVLEQERAEELSGAIANGEVADTAQNRRLAHPQFEWVTPKMVVAIDFAWAVHGCFRYAFPALREWHEIRSLGRRYHVPEIGEDEYPRRAVPEKRYFHVGAFESAWKNDGLRNVVGEAVNPYRRPHRPAFGAYKDSETGETRRVTYFEEASELDVDPVEANLFALEFEDLYVDTLNMDANSGLFYLLDRGIVKIGRGQIATYDQIARRSQFWNRLQEQWNIESLEKGIFEASISKAEHFALLEEHQNEVIAANVPQEANLELDLFG